MDMNSLRQICDPHARTSARAHTHTHTYTQNTPAGAALIIPTILLDNVSKIPAQTGIA